MRARRRIGLTGTPLDGRLEELHSIYEFLQPGLFRNRFQFLQHHANFDYWGGVKSYKHVDEFKRTIRPFYVRRLKSEVLKDLPEKVYQDVYVEMSAADMKTYKELAKRKHEITETAEAMTAIIRCRQFCDFPGILDLAGKEAKCDKLLELLEDILSDPKVKVLIFSQYRMVTDRLVKRLPYQLLYMSGDTPHKERQAMCHKFNDDPEVRILVMTDAGALGLNLQGASYVIHYDDHYSPSVMRQREDRAHRLGQKACVNVVRFICKDTVEERVRGILAAKAIITGAVLDEDCSEFAVGGVKPKDLLEAL
jgi:SNF2 family DNA or RNA helicase